MSYNTDYKNNLISVIDMMVGLSDREKEQLENAELEDLEEKYVLLMKEKEEEQLE